MTMATHRNGTLSQIPRLLALAAMAALAFSTGCGGDFKASFGNVPQDPIPVPLAALYDLYITVPALAMPQIPATGLVIDATLSIDPPGVDASGRFAGSIELVRVSAGGVDQPFAPVTPLRATGYSVGTDWRLDPFGPIQVGDPVSGTVLVTVSLDGQLSPDGRTLAGATDANGTFGTYQGAKQRRYLVAATDFGVTGTVSLIKVRYATLGSLMRILVEPDLSPVSGDPVARSTGGDAVIVNRYFFDNIQVLDSNAGFATIRQFSTGNGSNPHDVVAVDPDRFFTSRYEPPWNDLLISYRPTGEDIGNIDLSHLATNSTGTPRPDGMRMAEGLLFVGLQNIDSSFTEYGDGKVVVIDPATNRIVTTLTLSGKNPFGPPAVHPQTGDLYWALAGIFRGGLSQELSGGVEVIDPTSATSLGLLVDDDAMGGNVSSVALSETPGVSVPGGQIAVIGYCVVTTPAGVNLVRTFDPVTGQSPTTYLYQSSTLIPEVVADGDGWVLVPDYNLTTPRLLIFSATTGTLIAAPALSLPPFSVAVLTRSFDGL